MAGTASPLTETPAPLAATCETVTLELPVLESCTVCLAVLPTLRLPKRRLLGCKRHGVCGVHAGPAERNRGRRQSARRWR